ncbi:unnamed protein product [[Candida] boidinii]|nr:hypothetical protein B5S33_g3293 [[Candida] boidinii]GMF55359.1 unnamed protein product [[Candida] boidinii]
MVQTYDSSKEMEQQSWVSSKYGSSPALAALTGLLASSPILKVFASNAVPFLMWREKSQAKQMQQQQQQQQQQN